MCTCLEKPELLSPLSHGQAACTLRRSSTRGATRGAPTMVFVRLAMCAGLHCSLRAKAGTRAIMRTHLAPTMGTEWGLTSRTHSFACSSDFASFQGCATSACNATATRTDRVSKCVGMGIWRVDSLVLAHRTCRVAVAVRSAPFGPRSGKAEPLYSELTKVIF